MSYGLNIEMHKQVSIDLFPSHNMSNCLSMNGKLQMQKILEHRKMHFFGCLTSWIHAFLWRKFVVTILWCQLVLKGFMLL